MRVVHLPFYDDNPYQTLLMAAQRELGCDTLPGGGGGNFLRSALFRWNAESVHFHWLHPYMVRPSLVGTWVRSVRFALEVCLLRLRGIDLTWTLHNLQSHNAKFPVTERLFTRISSQIFHRIVCHSEAVAQLAKEKLWVSESKIVRCPHPSYIEAYPQRPDYAEQRQKSNIGDDETVFLFVGRLAAYKGVDELIAAFADLGCQNCRLIIAGNPVDESYGKQLESLTADQESVELRLGHVPDYELATLMAVADAVVLPFKSILNSGSAVLAMSFAKALIVPALGSIPEVVPDSPLVYSDSLKSALEWALENRSSLREIGKENLARASGWTWTDLARASMGEGTLK